MSRRTLPRVVLLHLRVDPDAEGVGRGPPPVTTSTSTAVQPAIAVRKSSTGLNPSGSLLPNLSSCPRALRAR